jgi:hypothetical protein
MKINKCLNMIPMLIIILYEAATVKINVESSEI